MKKQLITFGILGAMAVSLVGCKEQPKQNETTTIETIESSVENTANTEILDTMAYYEEEVLYDENGEVIGVDEEVGEIKTNGNEDVIRGNVGDIISVSEATDYAYEAGNIVIKSGDCVEVDGKSGLKALKAGEALIECDLMDNETGTQTHSSFLVIIE